MYFPFLRGKQFELIALREFAELLAECGQICPIIEPVKESSTFFSTCELLIKNEVDFTVIINPKVGDFKKKVKKVYSNLFNPLIALGQFNTGIILQENINFAKVSEDLKNFGINERPIVFVVESLPEIEELRKFNDNHNIKYIITDSEGSRKTLRTLKKVNKSLVVLSDPFNKLPRNKDYAKKPDEFFSDEHLYYKDDGFVGYSDFLTIGNEYLDKGYSPYAVAIHLTYFDADHEFRIAHFVSKSNDDISDVAGKFGEAMEKMIPFLDKFNIHTKASDEFRKLHKEGRYPGLGTVKKLSILNHIELVRDYFV
ncbi:sce7725 family protein [Spongiimicrobium sp. 2-473A-2-J]|uniref:sce7725 family protein n=1 Tax=Eudoraea algarum TaxID=3417568 RepID=UPI003D362946